MRLSVSAETVRDELRAELDAHHACARPAIRFTAPVEAGQVADTPAAELEVPIYAVDGLVRRADCLQMTRAGRSGAVDSAAEERRIA